MDKEAANQGRACAHPERIAATLAIRPRAPERDDIWRRCFRDARGRKGEPPAKSFERVAKFPGVPGVGSWALSPAFHVRSTVCKKMWQVISLGSRPTCPPGWKQTRGFSTWRHWFLVSRRHPDTRLLTCRLDTWNHAAKGVDTGGARVHQCGRGHLVEASHGIVSAGVCRTRDDTWDTWSV